MEDWTRVRLLRPLSLGPAVEVWRARMGRRRVVVRRYMPLRPGSPWPPPPDPAVLAAVNHPALVRFLDHWRDADGVECHGFVEARGETLADVLARGPLPPDRWTDVACRCAIGLRWLHERCPLAPRLHGDVSLRNIHVSIDGRARWLDVRADRPGLRPDGDVILGTLHCLAPEVLRGEAPSAASEIFALGLVALAAAVGPLPWRGARSPIEVLEAWDRNPPATLATRLPSPAGTLLEAMLAPTPADRPAARDVVTHLRKGLPARRTRGHFLYKG